jgi:hypothetical protein
MIYIFKSRLNKVSFESVLLYVIVEQLYQFSVILVDW